MIVTVEMAEAHARDHCPNAVETTALSESPGPRWMCGCGRCPRPDPTPADMLARIDQAWWAAQQTTVNG